MLKASGISVDDACRAGVWEATNLRGAWPGGVRRAGLVFDYHDLDGELLVSAGQPFRRIRLFEHERPIGKDGVLPKYLQAPGSPVHAYFPKCGDSLGVNWRGIASDPDCAVVVTEGEKKALAACLAEIPTIGLGGIWNFRRDGALLPELGEFEWAGREAYICFDSDVWENAQSLAAMRYLTKELAKRGAQVAWVRLPPAVDGGKQGLDDFLVAHGADSFIELAEAASFIKPGEAQIANGSDVELANAMLAALAVQHSSEIIFDEGHFWAFCGTHWRVIRPEDVSRVIYSFDGLKAGEKSKVRITTPKTRSIIAIAENTAWRRDFFKHEMVGVNCESGFVRFNADGEAELLAHDAVYRQRAIVGGRWWPDMTPVSSDLLDICLSGFFGDDEAARTLFQEVLGAVVSGCNQQLKEPKAVVIYGPSAANGKSEALKLLGLLVSKDVQTTITPYELKDDPKLAALSGKRLNVCSELGASGVVSSDRFKSCISGDPVTARRLYQDPITFIPKAFHVYATNHLPRFSGSIDPGVDRRIIILPFMRTIPKDERIPDIAKLISDREQDALLAYAIKGARRLIAQKMFSWSGSIEEAHAAWRRESDIIAAWLDDRAILEDGASTTSRALYEDFVEYAHEQNAPHHHIPDQPRFTHRLTAHNPGKIEQTRTAAERRLAGIKLRPRLVKGGAARRVRSRIAGE